MPFFCLPVRAAFLWTLFLGLVATAHPGSSPVIVSSRAGVTSAIYGSRVTLVASITPSVATGKVVFFDGVNVLGSATLSGGAASIVTTGLGYGKRQVVAAYLGDSTYAGGKSLPFAISVSTNPGGSFVSRPSGVPYMGVFPGKSNCWRLNHDGYEDIIGAALPAYGQSLPATVLIYLNNGNGTFTQGASYLGGTSQPLIAIADVNLDGNADVVAANTSGVFFLSGRGDGTFPNQSIITASSDVSILQIADMNGDGIPDLVLVHTSAKTISVLPGNGDGTFGASIDTPSALAISDLTVGDFNGDGIPDIAFGSRSVYAVAVLLGMGNGSFPAVKWYPSGDVNMIASADINGDDIPDLITANYNDNSITVLPGNGDGTFRQPFRELLGVVNTTGYPVIWPLFVGDFNGDGIPDILFPGGSNNGGRAPIYLIPGHGDGTFGQPIASSQSAGIGVVGDFNGDGVLDVADPYDCCDETQSAISFLYGTVAPMLTLSASANPAQAGQPLTLTVAASYPAATGTVTITSIDEGSDMPMPVGGTVDGTIPLVNGTGSVTIPALIRGTYQFQASYSGDATYAATTASPIQVLVLQPSPGITAFTASPNPALPGQSITFTAKSQQIQGNAPVGFYDGTTLLATSGLYSNQATLTTTLGPGTHRIRVVIPPFLGVAGASASLTERVTALPGGQLAPGPTYITSATCRGFQC